jgi:hypothetical protein
MSDGPTCETCPFWYGLPRPVGSESYYQLGQCRRLAPQEHTRQQSDGTFVYFAHWVSTV